MIFVIETIGMLFLIGIAWIVFFRAAEVKCWNFSLKWTLLPWTAIFFLHQLGTGLEFIPLGLFFISIAALGGKILKFPQEA